MMRVTQRGLTGYRTPIALIASGMAMLAASLAPAACADHPDAIRYSRADRAAMDALVHRVAPHTETVRGKRVTGELRQVPDLVQQVLDAAAADYLKRKETPK